MDSKKIERLRLILGMAYYSESREFIHLTRTLLDAYDDLVRQNQELLTASGWDKCHEPSYGNVDESCPCNEGKPEECTFGLEDK